MSVSPNASMRQAFSSVFCSAVHDGSHSVHVPMNRGVDGKKCLLPFYQWMIKTAKLYQYLMYDLRELEICKI